MVAAAAVVVVEINSYTIGTLKRIPILGKPPATPQLSYPEPRYSMASLTSSLCNAMPVYPQPSCTKAILMSSLSSVMLVNHAESLQAWESRQSSVVNAHIPYTLDDPRL